MHVNVDEDVEGDGMTHDSWSIHSRLYFVPQLAVSGVELGMDSCCSMAMGASGTN